jgi:hypothetical protein
MIETQSNHRPNRLKLTLDGWAVTIAFLFALLVRAGVLKRVPW